MLFDCSWTFQGTDAYGCLKADSEQILSLRVLILMNTYEQKLPLRILILDMDT